VKAATDILGDKWTPRLLRELANHGPLRFGALQTQVAGINPRTLSARLDFLEERKIITRHSYSEVPPRVEYSLTEKGASLWPILSQMCDWGAKYGSEPCL
ncbi:MAG TPA: helix-turn-helix domain-containing protein, partial [Candidatus Saccharimonadales bacterium]